MVNFIICLTCGAKIDREALPYYAKDIWQFRRIFVERHCLIFRVGSRSVLLPVYNDSCRIMRESLERRLLGG